MTEQFSQTEKYENVEQKSFSQAFHSIKHLGSYYTQRDVQYSDPEAFPEVVENPARRREWILLEIGKLETVQDVFGFSLSLRDPYTSSPEPVFAIEDSKAFGLFLENTPRHLDELDGERLWKNLLETLRRQVLENYDLESSDVRMEEFMIASPDIEKKAKSFLEEKRATAMADEYRRFSGMLSAITHGYLLEYRMAYRAGFTDKFATFQIPNPYKHPDLKDFMHHYQHSIDVVFETLETLQKNPGNMPPEFLLDFVQNFEFKLWSDRARLQEEYRNEQASRDEFLAMIVQASDRAIHFKEEMKHTLPS